MGRAHHELPVGYLEEMALGCVWQVLRQLKETHPREAPTCVLHAEDGGGVTPTAGIPSWTF